MMPVDIAIHLVLREQQRLERGESLLGDAHALHAGVRVLDQRERIEQAIGVDVAVVHAAHERVALEVLDLV